MALNPTLPLATRNGLLNTYIGTPAASGILRIYDGAQPASPDTAISTQVTLAELTMNATAFPSTSTGTLTANSITADSSNNATGTAAWFRLWKSDGTTPLVDGTVGTSGCDLNLSTTALVSGGTCSVTSLTISHP